MTDKRYYLFGKQIEIADIQTLHDSCSSQHAVIQFRNIFKKRETSEDYDSLIIPYIIDLNSETGTYLNKEKIEPSKYYQLLDEDLINIGHSTRDYIVKLVKQANIIMNITQDLYLYFK